MKTVIYENINIEKFRQFFTTLRREHPQILGAEWDERKRILKIFYEDAATEVTKETIRSVKIPTILRFKKKFEAPKIDASNVSVTAISENEFTVETHEPETVRKEIKKTFIEFEEVIQL